MARNPPANVDDMDSVRKITWKRKWLQWVNSLHEVAKVSEFQLYHLSLLGVSQVVLVVKNPPANAGNTRDCGFNPWIRKIPWRRAWQSTQVFLPGESHGLRSLVGQSPWGRKESDTAEHAAHMALTRGANSDSSPGLNEKVGWVLTIYVLTIPQVILTHTKAWESLIWEV